MVPPSNLSPFLESFSRTIAEWAIKIAECPRHGRVSTDHSAAWVEVAFVAPKNRSGKINRMSQNFYTVFAHLNHWHWGLFAIGLTLLEWVFPFSWFLWLGLAAGVVSGVVFLWPAMGWGMELALFVSVALGSMALSRLLSHQPSAPRRPHHPSPLPAPPGRASQYVGRLFTLTQPIQGGVGLLKIGSTVWTIRGLDMVAGTPVKVVGFEGSILSVETMEP